MTNKSEQFRRNAGLCARRARQTRDPGSKRELEELARGWLLLAEHAERSSDYAVRLATNDNDD